jgi:hypothetical protein
MRTRERLLVAVGILAVGLGAEARIADAQSSDRVLCELATKALRAGTKDALQVALGRFPTDTDHMSKRVQLCRARLAQALIELAGPAAPAPAPAPSAPRGGHSGGYG